MSPSDVIELPALLLSAFILGLLGAGHCFGMCGGLMSALSLAVPKEHSTQRLKLLISYNLGRISSYTAAGLLLGLAGWAVTQGPAAFALRIAAGLLLIAMGLYLAGWWKGLLHIEQLGRGLWRYVQPLAARLMPVSNAPQAFLLGALWGWLPCGLVYSTLLWAASQGSATHSAALMFAFGLGTLPVLLVTGVAAERSKAWLSRSNVRISAGVLIIVFGLWTLPGPHQSFLMGH